MRAEASYILLFFVEKPKSALKPTGKSPNWLLNLGLELMEYEVSSLVESR